MKKIESKQLHEGQPPGWPDEVELRIHDIPVRINYPAGNVITPKAISQAQTTAIGWYLVEEGFLVQR